VQKNVVKTVSCRAERGPSGCRQTVRALVLRAAAAAAELHRLPNGKGLGICRIRQSDAAAAGERCTRYNIVV